MANELLVKSKGEGFATGVLVELSNFSTPNPPDPNFIKLKRRARRNGYSLLKQVLVDQLKGFYKLTQFRTKKAYPLLAIALNCGNSVEYWTYNDIPNESVPCPCGNPAHWFIRYVDLR